MNQPAAHTASMRTSIRLLAATAAAASLLLTLTLVLMWATGVTVDQPQEPNTSVFVSVHDSTPVGLNAVVLAIPLTAAALAGMGALLRRPRLIRLSIAPAVVIFAVTWALIINAYVGEEIPLRPRIEATWPATLLFSAVAFVAASSAWWFHRARRSQL